MRHVDTEWVPVGKIPAPEVQRVRNENFLEFKERFRVTKRRK